MQTILTTTDALIVVDVQNDFLPLGSLATPSGNTILQPIYALMHTAALNSIPVVASRDYHPSDHSSFLHKGGMWPVHCVETTPGAEFAPGFPVSLISHEIRKGTDANKEVYSAFEDSDLDEWLKERSVQRVIVVGIATEYCVWSTARDALKLGYETVVVEDLIAEVDPGKKRDELKRFIEHGLQVVHSSALKFESE